jgi:hypothetical protein
MGLVRGGWVSCGIVEVLVMFSGVLVVSGIWNLESHGHLWMRCKFEIYSLSASFLWWGGG